MRSMRDGQEFGRLTLGAVLVAVMAYIGSLGMFAWFLKGVARHFGDKPAVGRALFSAGYQVAYAIWLVVAAVLVSFEIGGEDGALVISLVTGLGLMAGYGLLLLAAFRTSTAMNGYARGQA